MTTPDGGEPRPRMRPRREEVSRLFEALERREPEQAKILVNALGLRLVLIPAGAFTMGSPPDEPGRRANEGPPRLVDLTRPFYLGAAPVTQQQYKQVMGTNPSRFNEAGGGGPEFPVERVSWDDAVLFCRRLSELPAERAAGRVYRLPTEAEWEYACRAGTATAFAYGAALASMQANFDGNYPYGGAPKDRALGKTSKVGSYAANNFGLSDAHGNVWEWCADWYGERSYAQSPPRDPTGPAEGQFRVARGGCWRNQAATCRAAYRNALVPNNRDPYTGFRVAADVARGT